MEEAEKISRCFKGGRGREGGREGEIKEHRARSGETFYGQGG